MDCFKKPVKFSGIPDFQCMNKIPSVTNIGRKTTIIIQQKHQIGVCFEILG